MKKLMSRWGIIFTTLHAIMYLYAIISLFIYTMTGETNYPDSMIFVLLFIIISCPIIVEGLYDNDNFRRWAKFLMFLVYAMAVAITSISAMSWYMYPENTRWESFTLINGFVVSVIPLLQLSWDEEDRVITIFFKKDTSDKTNDK